MTARLQGSGSSLQHEGLDPSRQPEARSLKPWVSDVSPAISAEPLYAYRIKDSHGLISVVVVSDGALLAAQRPPRARAVQQQLQIANCKLQICNLQFPFSIPSAAGNPIPHLWGDQTGKH